MQSLCHINPLCGSRRQDEKARRSPHVQTDECANAKTHRPGREINSKAEIGRPHTANAIRTYTGVTVAKAVTQ